MDRLDAQQYIAHCAANDAVLLTLGVERASPGAEVLIPIDRAAILPADRRKGSIIYYELGTIYDSAIEGQFIIEHVFRIDCRSGEYDGAEAVRKAMIACLRRGGRLAREGARFDAYDSETQLYRRVQEIAIEP